MSGTHDILAAERAEAAARQSSQGIWQGRSEGQKPAGATFTADNLGKEASSRTAQDTYGSLGHSGPDISSKDLGYESVPGRQHDTYQGTKLDEAER
ncbi:hypothetical protein DXG01_006934 [Tephrocybe rancida]|nr:hypothetical protein DXG01_006934 [Tephrocybe rancida]